MLYKMLYNGHASPRGPYVAIQLYSAIQRYTLYSYTSLYTIQAIQHPSDLALGLVVLLEAPPGVSDGKAGLVVLDAASALECAAHLDNVVQVGLFRDVRGRLRLGGVLGVVKRTLRPLCHGSVEEEVDVRCTPWLSM